VAAIVAVLEAGLPGADRRDEFGLVFSSIVVEALPFILVGALVSAVLAVLIPERFFARVGRLPVGIQLPGAMACAFAFPVCECGSVPAARRLIRQGLHPAAGLGFMFAAPVINPVVLGATWVAYRSSGHALEMTLARLGVGVLVAAVAGLLLARAVPARLPEAATESHHHHDHDHPSKGQLGAIADQVSADFLFMGKFLVVGAAVAAAAQTFLPRSLFDSLGGSLVLGSLALMALAIVLSLCSEADAFVAISFTSFALPSQLAFLALGPVLDAKLALLYSGTFRRWFVPALLAVAVPIILVASILLEPVLR
jgi:uncharacterized membrane protein YraQ (UPF0718 family)